jgi:hypothetical protein
MLLFSLLSCTPGALPPAKIITFDDIFDAEGRVEITALAHYTVVIHQTTPASGCRESEEHWLYAVFPPNDPQNRAVNLLVQSPVAPESLVSFEPLTITGVIQRAAPPIVPFDTEIKFGERSNYYFVDNTMLMLADTVTGVK